jgi:hypothetical protein
MKTLFTVMMIFGAGLLMSNVTGCATEDQPSGATTSISGSYTELVDASPDKVTDAAKKSADDLKLLDIIGTGTKVDGNVTAQTAQGDNVQIDIVQAGDNVSKVTIRIGPNGNPTVSHELMDRIKNHLKWF